VRLKGITDDLGCFLFSVHAQGKHQPRIVAETTKRPDMSGAATSELRLATIRTWLERRRHRPRRIADSSTTNDRLATLEPAATRPQGWSNDRSVASGLFLAILCGFMALIIYYEMHYYESTEETAFDNWMDTQKFGVRFLFNSLGVLISFFWDSKYTRVSTLEPYRRLALRPQPAQRSIMLSPATSAFIAVLKSTLQLRRNFVVASAALMAVLATFTPILFSNIPFNPIQTYDTHQRCTWLAVVILALMILVLLVNLIFIKYPRLPVSPDTVGGGLYYICDSQMTEELGREGAAAEELLRSRVWGSRAYSFREMIGVSGQRRVGVDLAKDGVHS